MRLLPRSRRGTWLLAGCAVFVVASCSSRPRPSYVIRTNLKQILTAIAQFRYEHGKLPIDERGPDFALYALRANLPASCFDSTDDKSADTRAAWDDTEHRIKNSDFEYLNEASIGKYPDRIVLMARSSNGKTAHFGYVDGTCYARDFPTQPDRRILGCWITVDNFLVEGESLFETISRTHAAILDHRWSTVSENGRLKSADANGNHFVYRFSGANLTHCTIRTTRGIIEEEFETDNLGRITGCERGPANWSELLSDPDHK